MHQKYNKQQMPSFQFVREWEGLFLLHPNISASDVTHKHRDAEIHRFGQEKKLKLLPALSKAH